MIGRIASWFKSSFISSIWNAATEKSQDSDNSSNSNRSRYLDAKQYPKYPELPNTTDNRFAENSRYGADSDWDWYRYYWSTTGIDFFIEKERTHYRVLDTYVFQPLSKLTALPRSEGLPIAWLDSELPEYQLDKAILHMKKHGDNLHMYLEDFKKRLDSYKILVSKMNHKVDAILENEIQRSGYDEANPECQNFIALITEIAKKEIPDMYGAVDLREWLVNFEPHWQSYYVGLDPRETVRIAETIVNFLHNEEMVQSLVILPDLEKEIQTIMGNISTKAERISRSIKDTLYETHADCCPTYWSLFKRFI